jgi:plasmid maintenance system killer protein
MKVSFEDAELERLVITHQSKKYKKYIRDKKFLWALDRVFNDLQGAAKCSDLKQLSYLHYERLRKKGMSSVRVMNGRVERLLFQELENGIRITVIELDESHYGQR